WTMVSAGNVEPGRGGTVQLTRLGFLANKDDDVSVGIDEWAVSRPVKLTTYNLSFSTRVLNSYEMDPRELTILASTDFNGVYDFENVTNPGSNWTDISNRFTFPNVDNGMQPVGEQDISDLV